MENFLSVSIPSRKAKKAVLEKMLQSANLNEDNASLNYGIFEGDDRNIILKLELPAQLSEKQSDLVAHNLSEDLFGLGYNDFDIEISTDEVENNPTLESNDWHNIVNERAFEIVGLQDGNNNFLRGKQVNQNLPYVMATMQGRLFKIHADTALLNKFLKIQKNNPSFKQDGAIQGGGTVAQTSTDTTKADTKKADTTTQTDKTTQTGPEPGSRDALTAIANQYAKPGMTLADVDAMERAAIASETKSADDDANIFSKAWQGFKRFARSKDWRVMFVLATAAEKMGLPGLFNSKGRFIYMAEEKQDDEGGAQTGGPSAAAGTSLSEYMKLAKVGLVPDKKLEKIKKAFANQPKNMLIVDKIVAAQKAATAGKIKGDLPGDGKTDAERTASADTTNDKTTTTTTTSTDTKTTTGGNPYENLSEKEATEKAFELLKRLGDLIRANPEITQMAENVEETKKILMKRLHNDYMFEDASADEEIYNIVRDLRFLLPKLSDANKRMLVPLVKQSQPYIKRHQASLSKSKTTTKSKDKDDTEFDQKVDKTPVTKDKKKDQGRLNVPGNPLADFAKSGKGGLANDPDEVLAIEELQRFLGITVDGKYGPATKKAVADYQKKNGLKVDGDAGPETIGHMMNSQKSKDDGPGMPDGDPAIYDPNFKDQIDKKDDKKDDTKGEKKATLTDGVAPPEEQTLENAIKFNWKNKSYYVSVNKIEITDDNKIAWVFYKDEKLTRGQKVDTLDKYWADQLEAELARRGEGQALKVIKKADDNQKSDDNKTDDNKTDDKKSDASIPVQTDADGVDMKTAMDTKLPMFDSLADFQLKKANLEKQGKIKPGDRVMVQLGGSIVGKYYEHMVVGKGELMHVVLVDEEDPKFQALQTGTTDDKKSTDKDDKKTTDKDDEKTTDKDAEKTDDDKTDDDKPTVKSTDSNIANRAEAIWDATVGKWGRTDEKAVQKALQGIDTLEEYEAMDEAFRNLDDNDDEESIMEIAIDEMGTKDLETYFYSELRRLGVPHKLAPGDYTRLQGFMDGKNGKEFNDKIANNYDPKTGNFIKRK